MMAHSAFKNVLRKVEDCEPSESHDRNSIAPAAACRIMSANLFSKKVDQKHPTSGRIVNRRDHNSIAAVAACRIMSASRDVSRG